MRKPLERITITIPADLVRKADARARREGRSRSWVLSEAVRQYVSESAGKTVSVQEPARRPYPQATGLGAQRQEQLEADLLLTPTQRVREAEEMYRIALLAHPQPRFEQVVMFDTLEDFFAWKKKDVLW